MLKLKYQFIFFISILSAISCNKESNFDEIKKAEIIVQYRSQSYFMTQYEQNFTQFWTAAIDKYTMATFCQCNCTALNTTQKALNEFSYLLPEVFTFDETNLSCNQLGDFWLFGCNKDKDKLFSDFRTHLKVKPYLTSDEINIIDTLLNDLYTKGSKIEFNKYREMWVNLNTQSNVSNMLSAIPHFSIENNFSC